MVDIGIEETKATCSCDPWALTPLVTGRGECSYYENNGAYVWMWRVWSVCEGEIVVFNYILEEHSTCKCNRSSQKVTFQSKLALFSTDL